MTQFAIERGIPIPPARKVRVGAYGAPRYPWDALMANGDSFLVRGGVSATQQNVIRSAARKRENTHPGEHYVTRVVEGGVRVWRVAASGIETEGQDHEDGLGAEPESPTAATSGGDAQP